MPDGGLARIVPRQAGVIDGAPVFRIYLENFSSRYLEETQATLFLSSAAKDGEMVGKAAGFAYWPVGTRVVRR